MQTFFRGWSGFSHTCTEQSSQDSADHLGGRADGFGSWAGRLSLLSLLILSSFGAFKGGVASDLRDMTRGIDVTLMLAFSAVEITADSVV